MNINYRNKPVLATVGRIDRTHLEVMEVKNGGLVIDLMTPGKILKAHVSAGLERDGGYVIHNVDGYCRAGETLDVRKTVYCLLSDKRFASILAQHA